MTEGEIQPLNISEFFESDKAHECRTSIQTLPVFQELEEWKFLAMVEGLGSPTFFMTLPMSKNRRAILLRVPSSSKYFEKPIPTEGQLLKLSFMEMALSSNRQTRFG